MSESKLDKIIQLNGLRKNNKQKKRRINRYGRKLVENSTCSGWDYSNNTDYLFHLKSGAL